MSAREWTIMAGIATAQMREWKARALAAEAALRGCETSPTTIASLSRSRLELRLQSINTVVQTAALEAR